MCKIYVASIYVASICVQAFIPFVQDGSDIEAVCQMCWMCVRCAGCVLDASLHLGNILEPHVQDVCQMLHCI